MIGRLVSLIYFYLVSVISLILIIIGIYAIVTFILNTTQYDKYPLRFLAEDCENIGYPYKGPYSTGVMVESPVREASMSSEEKARLKASCDQRVEFERKQHQIEDIRNSIVFTLMGAILFAIHFPTARKISREK